MILSHWGKVSNRCWFENQQPINKLEATEREDGDSERLDVLMLLSQRQRFCCHQTSTILVVFVTLKVFFFPKFDQNHRTRPSEKLKSDSVKISCNCCLNESQTPLSWRKMQDKNCVLHIFFTQPLAQTTLSLCLH